VSRNKSLRHNRAIIRERQSASTRPRKHQAICRVAMFKKVLSYEASHFLKASRSRAVSHSRITAQEKDTLLGATSAYELGHKSDLGMKSVPLGRMPQHRCAQVVW